MSILTSLHGLLHDHGLFTCLLHIYIVFYMMVFLHGLFTLSFTWSFFTWSFYMVFLHGLLRGLFSQSFFMVFLHGLFSWSCLFSQVGRLGLNL